MQLVILVNQIEIKNARVTEASD